MHESSQLEGETLAHNTQDDTAAQNSIKQTDSETMIQTLQDDYARYKRTETVQLKEK